MDAIDRIGVSAIARSLGISKQAVRKWRRRGSIPEDRQGDIRQPPRNSPRAGFGGCPGCRGFRRRQSGSARARGRNQPPPTRMVERAFRRQQALTVMPAVRPRLEQIAGKACSTDDDLAHRRARRRSGSSGGRQGGGRSCRPAADLSGPQPTGRVSAILFALDFPILTMAFVAVTQVSPIIAAGSAIALSLGLVLAAHAAGARLRDLARHLPPWVRDLAALATMLLLIAAVIGVVTDLRLKGFELDGQLLADAQAGLFDEQPDVLSDLPDPFVWAIVRAAGLVTVLLTVFGLSWSYRQHGPQSAFARAEADYRKGVASLRRPPWRGPRRQPSWRRFRLPSSPSPCCRASRPTRPTARDRRSWHSSTPRPPMTTRIASRSCRRSTIWSDHWRPASRLDHPDRTRCAVFEPASP